MKRGSIAGSKQNIKKKKKPVTNSEKAQFFVDKLQETIANQIQKGKISINKNKRHINKDLFRKNGDRNRYGVSLQNIEENLSLIRASIIEQKRGQQEAEKIKLMQAKGLITKMKKDKEQHKLKMKESQQRRQMNYAKIFSDTAMEKMRKKLQERVQLKKKQIQERIKEKATKKHERGLSYVDQQVEYSQYLKGLKQKSKSSTKLPSLLNPEKEERNHSVLLQHRQHSLSSIRKQLNTNKSSKNIAFQLQKAIEKRQNGKFKYLQQDNEVQFSKMKSNQAILTKIDRKVSQNQENTSFLANRSKIYGNEYLKQSILKVKKSSQPENSILADNKLSVTPHQALINKNQYLENLKEKWLRVLSRIEHTQISEQQGIDLLHSMQKRLDKIDNKGITERLKKKLQIFAKLHQKNESSNEIKL